MARANHKIQLKKAGLVTKILILLLLIYAGFTLWNLNSRIDRAKSDVASLSDQVQVQQRQNAELVEDIAESNDLEQRKDVARAKLGLLEPGERVFHITD